MKLKIIKELLQCTPFYESNDLLEEEFDDVCGSDLMSDVLAFVKGKCLLMTGLINGQVIRTAEMMDIKAVVIVRGKRPTSEMIQLARDKNIAIYNTHLTMYQACGILYSNGLGVR